MFTKQRSIHDTVAAFKEAIGWLKNQIGPANVERFHERIEDLYTRAVQEGKRLARRTKLAK